MKIAVLGTWHVHAPGYADVAKEKAELVGVYEENEAWCREFAEKYQIKQYKSREELLSDDVDGVIICSATNRHTEDVIAAARAGKAIFIEKVLALTERECKKIYAEVKKAGVPFVISFPWKFESGVRTVRQMVEEGKIGKVNYIRFRNCHSGSTKNWLPAHFYNEKQCGGGAMIDLGAHGMYIIDMLKGLPDRYESAFGRFCQKPEVLEKNRDGIEDNAVTAMTYRDGTVAINETGFVTLGCPVRLEVGGEDGYLTLIGNKLAYSSVGSDYAPVDVELLPALPKPIDLFVIGQTPEGCGLEEAMHLTTMMCGAYKHR